MRIDPYGESVFETLGEYLRFCKLVGGPDSEAVRFLEAKIKEQGEETKVIAAHSQMMMLLHSMLFKKAKKEEYV
jgi:hypothetical protein